MDQPQPSFHLGDVQRLGADRQPCPVCGHPTGDCVGEDSRRPHRNPLTLGEAGMVMDGRTPADTILVEEDIWGERQITPFTVARVLLAAKGSYVSQEKARELGIL